MRQLPYNDLGVFEVTWVAVRIGIVLAGLLSSAVAPGLLAASVDQDLPLEQRRSILVELEPGADLAAIVEFAGDRGGYCHHQYRSLPRWINLRQVDAATARGLGRLTGVRRVLEDRPVQAMLDDSTPLVRGLRDQLAAAGLSTTGDGIRVCVVDTGIDPSHAMFGGRVDRAAGYDFIEDDDDPADDHGHGTHVAGILAGELGSLQGIAPGATLIGVKVLNEAGSGFLSTTIAGIDYCASPDLPGGPAQVINLSLGSLLSSDGSCDDEPSAQAAARAGEAGVIVVGAAGNFALPRVIAPACGSAVIAVAATYDDDYPNDEFPNPGLTTFPACTDVVPRRDQLACFNHTAVQIDVAAPGCRTVSADPADLEALRDRCGTSMSAPHVAGLAALLLESDPTMTPDAVRARIHAGSLDLGAPGFDTGYGHGRIDVRRTLQLGSACSVDDECDDGLFCTGIESCIDGECVADSMPACAGQFCDESTAVCTACTHDAACDDGVLCNGVESCDSGVCRAASPDERPCGEALCNADTNRCVECLNDADCDNVDPCALTESCNQLGNCVAIDLDCNRNGIQDSCDLSGGTSMDRHPANGFPDECDARVRFRVQEVGTVPGLSSAALAINDRDQVVGTALSIGDRRHAFLWDKGQLTDLGTLGGFESIAWDINNDGVIVGWADHERDGSFPFTPPKQATRWVNTDVIKMTYPDGEDFHFGFALGINDAGHVVGHLGGNGQVPKAVFWDDSGQPSPIFPYEPQVSHTDPNTLGPIDQSQVWSINEHDEAVGFYENPLGNCQGISRAFVHVAGRPPRQLGTLGGCTGAARAINDDDVIVGFSTRPNEDAHSVAFVREPTRQQLENLNELIPLDSGWDLRDAYDINRHGHIVGFGINPDGFQRGFLLTPCDPCFPTPPRQR